MTAPITYCVAMIVILCWPAMVARASATQQADASSSPAPQSLQDSSTNPQSATRPQQNAVEKKETAAKGGEETDNRGFFHSGSVVVAPLPIVNPALGTGITPILGYIFPLQAKEPGTQPSVIGAGGLVTDNGSRGFALGTDLYLQEGRYELKALYAHGNLDYNLYGAGFVNGNGGLKLPLEQSGQAFFVKFLRKIGWNVYVGPRFFTGSSFITLKIRNSPIPIPPGIGLHSNLRAVGFEVSRDTRLNRFYPVQGSQIDFTSDYFSQGLGSKYSYQSYKATFNKYFGLSPKQVLAYNAYWCGTTGSPPFYGNCIYGTNDELRGYTAGRYLDRVMFATQLEYRLVLPWRFGVVGFGGVGAVFPGSAQIFRSRQFLPAGGTGIRYMLSKKYHVNLRTDFAWGKDNFTWGLGVGEAF